MTHGFEKLLFERDNQPETPVPTVPAARAVQDGQVVLAAGSSFETATLVWRGVRAVLAPPTGEDQVWFVDDLHGLWGMPADAQVLALPLAQLDPHLIAVANIRRSFELNPEWRVDWMPPQRIAEFGVNLVDKGAVVVNITGFSWPFHDDGDLRDSSAPVPTHEMQWTVRFVRNRRFLVIATLSMLEDGENARASVFVKPSWRDDGDFDEGPVHIEPDLTVAGIANMGDFVRYLLEDPELVQPSDERPPNYEEDM